MAEDLKKALNDKKLICGAKETIKALKLGKVKKVFLASNCPDKIANDIQHYAKLCGASVNKLQIPDKEIGLLSKKHYSITVLSH